MHVIREMIIIKAIIEVEHACMGSCTYANGKHKQHVQQKKDFMFGPGGGIRGETGTVALPSRIR